MTPLLRGAIADQARQTARRISDRLLAARAPSDASLAEGTAGLALVHAGLAQAFPGRGHEDAARDAVERSARGFARAGRVPPSLFEGYVGLAWATEVIANADDSERLLDRELAAYLAGPARKGPYDLAAGLLGIGVYALERAERSWSERLLGAIVDRLSERAVRAGPGVAWRTRQEWVGEGVSARGRRGWMLGVAHGAAGAIALLARVARSNAPDAVRRRARALFDEAVPWLLAHDDPEGYPATLGGERNRMGWCHGDPGIAAALAMAAELTDEDGLRVAATRIGLRAAELAPRRARLAGGLCHGAAGLAHVFHRLYCTTGDVRFARTSRAWFARLLASPLPKRSGWLSGAGGIALALLAATGDADAAWDRALLLSSGDAGA